MHAGPSTLKLAGGLGGLVACGVSGLVVATNTRPVAAPLHPPADPHAPLASPVSSAAAQAGALSVPVTPVCQGPGMRGATTTTDAAVRQVLASLRQATAGQQRRQILQQAMQQLTADERQQLTAALQASRAASGGTVGRSAASCRGGVIQPVTSQPGIVPSVVDAPPSTAPVTVSAVS